MRHALCSLCFSILLLQAPVAPVEEPETTCAAAAIAFAPEPAAEAVSVRLTFFQRFQLFRARSAHRRRVLVQPNGQ